MNDNQQNQQHNAPQQQQQYAPQQYAPQQQQQQMPQHYPQGQYPQHPQKPPMQLTFPTLIKALFSPQPLNAFRVQQSPLCKWLIIGITWIFASLAMGSTFAGKFGVNFGVSLGFNLILIGAVIGFLFLAQVMGKPQNPGFNNLIDVFSTSLLFSFPFFFLAFIFGFFYDGGAGALLSTALIVGLIMLIKGFEVRLGKVKGVVIWALLAMVLILVIIVDLTGYLSQKGSNKNEVAGWEDLFNEDLFNY